MTRMCRNDSPDVDMASHEGDPVATGTSRMQDAVRLLLLVDGAGEKLPDPPPLDSPPGICQVK